MQSKLRLTALGAGLCLALASRPAAAQDGLPLPPKLAHPSASKPATTVPTTVTTGFDPKLDPAPFSNPADFAEPNGECMGMSAVAIDNFLRRKAAEATGAPAPAIQPEAHSPQAADAVEEAVVSRAQSDFDDEGDARNSPVHEVSIHNPKLINAALERIARTGEPEMMTIAGREDGHATVLFGYKDGKLQIYDPNYPRKTIEWPFDPKKGLGRHPEGSDDSFYKKLTTAGSTPLSSFRSAKDLALIRSDPAALAKVDAKRYPTVVVKTTSEPTGSVVVSGTVSRGPTKTLEGDRTHPATRVWVLVDGKPVTRAKIVKGAYKVTLAAKDFTGDSNDVRVVALAGSGDEELFAGFADTTVGPRTGIAEVLQGAASHP